MKTLEQLLARWEEGTLDSADVADLKRLLRDPAGRAELVEDWHLRAAICEYMRERKSAANTDVQTAMPPVRLREVPVPADRESAGAVAPLRLETHSRWRFAAAAAVILVFLGWAAWQAMRSRETATRSVATAGGKVAPAAATVVETRGEVVAKSRAEAVKKGALLRPGESVRTGSDGYLKCAYGDGTVVEFGDNSTFGLIDGATPLAKAVLLENGVLTADIAKQPADGPMRFKTPHAVATVMGTVLHLTVTPEGSELSVQTGVVEFAAAGKREMVASGESATVRDGVLRKSQAKGAAVTGGDIHENERTLLRDSFENGLTNWMLYTRRGNGGTRPTTEEECPDIRIVRADRNGTPVSAVELVGRAPDGPRVGIVTRPVVAATGTYSLSYEYTFDGRPRNAMEGLEIHMGRAFSQKALAPGLWNKVRWECVRKSDAQGKPYLDASLFFNGELIGRTEYALTGEGIDLVLEVVEGRFRFTNVEIREMRSKDGI